MHKDKGQGLLKAKINLLLKELYAWDETTQMTCPVRNL